MSLSDEMLDMENWAVIGASDKNSTFGYKLYKKLKNYEYNVFPVNPNCEYVDGDETYPSLTDLDEEIDVVNFVVNPKTGIEVLKECIELGIKNIWLQPGTRSKEIHDLANKNNINVVNSCVLIEL
jgi:predicted CoA-binding protein